jgi:hypothetical protein
MTTAADLTAGVALRCHDPSKLELTDAQYLILVNQAIDDLTAEQIVTPLAEDESLTLAANVWDYTVPADFAYIKELRQESAAASSKYPNVIHPSLWRLTIETTTTAIIKFDENEFTPVAGLHLKVIGQKRVAQLSGVLVAEPGLESFIRERAIGYAADILAGGVSELSAWRRALVQEAWTRSNLIMQRIPREWRPLPDSKRVPGR